MSESAKLLEDLDAVHADLEGAGRLDAAAREKLRLVARDIRRALERASDREPAAKPAAEEDHQPWLREAALQFEAEHPDAAAALHRIADALAGLGI